MVLEREEDGIFLRFKPPLERGLPDDEEFDQAAELAECLDQLAQAGRRERVDFLIEKERVSGLSEDERAELRQLH